MFEWTMLIAILARILVDFHRGLQGFPPAAPPV